MKIICAWCNKEMGSKECSRKEDDKVTHGICGYCKKVAKRELGKEVKFAMALINHPPQKA